MISGTSTHSADEIRAAFVRDIATRAQLPTYATAESVAAAVMCAITERLTSGGAHVLLQSLPEAIQPLFERCSLHRTGPVRRIGRAELLEAVADHLDITPFHAEGICQVVLSAVRNRLAVDVAGRVASQLPADLRALWLANAAPPSVAGASEDELERARADIYATVERSGALPGGIEGADAFQAVMCIFSQRLSGGEARHLACALPSSVRPLVVACMLHRDEPAAAFHKEEFFRQVAEHLGATPTLAERIVRAVFSAVIHWIPAKDVEDVAGQLPGDLRSVWLGR
jgi:uncharacterized protein (DUF2267 family)